MKLRFRLAVSALLAGIASAQPAHVLDIEIDKGVFYVYDTIEFAKYATTPGVVAPWSVSAGGPARNFWSGVYIADIVSVNGRPARGVMVRRGTRIGLTTNLAAGQAIADTTRGFIDDGVWEIQTADGTAVGTFTTHGFIGGAPPPGAPPEASGTNLAVTGGTGAFYGARGQLVGAPLTGNAGPRVQASVTEDPANRRTNGGRSRFLVQLLPAARPEIIGTHAGPAIVHAGDGRPVTATNPAGRGEALTLYARGLGPTSPSVALGQLFGTASRHVAIGPVEVLINGASAEVTYAGGYPGAADAYQVNFVVPDGLTPGTAKLHLSSAYVSSSPAEIPVR